MRVKLPSAFCLRGITKSIAIVVAAAIATVSKIFLKSIFLFVWLINCCKSDRKYNIQKDAEKIFFQYTHI